MLEIQFEKTNEKHTPFIPLPLFSLTFFIRNEYRITREKVEEVKTTMFSKDDYTRSKLSYKNSIFCQKTIFWK